MWILLLGLLALPGPARAEGGSPADDLTFNEKQSMPAWLYADYVAEIKRLGRDGAPTVVDRFRKILQAMDKLPPAKRDELVAEGSRATTRERRDELVLNYTGVQTRLGPENSLPRGELSDFEKDGMLPEGLGLDYSADLAAAKDPNNVVSKYRRIINAFNALSPDRKQEFQLKLRAARNRPERDDLVARYTGVQESRPITTVQLGNDNASVALNYPAWHPNPDTSIGLTMKGGMLAPMGQTGDQYSTLRPSPYIYTAVNAAYNGAIKATLSVTGAVAVLESAKAFSDPTVGNAAINPNLGTASTAAGDRTSSHFNQMFMMTSVYGDAGTIVKLGHDVRQAFYVAGEGMVYGPTAPSADNTNPMMPIVSLSAGTMWMMRHGPHEMTWFTDVNLQGAEGNTRLYQDITVAPTVRAGWESALVAHDMRRYALGAEASSMVGPGQGDNAVRPYLSVRKGDPMAPKAGDVSAMVAGDFHTGTDFLPQVAGGGAKVGWQATNFMKVGFQGSLADQKYSMAPGPELGYTGMATLDFDLNHGVKVQSRLRAPQRDPGDGNIVGNTYAMRNRLPNPGAVAPANMPTEQELTHYAPSAKYAIDFKQAFLDSPTMEQFGKAIGAKSLDQILTALATLSFNLNKWDYDYGIKGWDGSNDQLYGNIRNSILNNKKNPDLQCQGGATFLAGMAVLMGQQAGIQIEAEMVGVQVPASNGTQDDHAVAAIKTKQYGIVFLDWGALTPTYTFDTRKALEIFQGLNGIPAVAHYLADTQGRFGGYLFSNDGKVMVENWSYHSELPSSDLNQTFHDDPESDSIMRGHFKKAMDQSFREQDAAEQGQP